MNWTVLILFGIAIIALVVFLVLRNIKDKRQLEEQLKNDYPKPKGDEGDTDAEETTK